MVISHLEGGLYMVKEKQMSLFPEDKRIIDENKSSCLNMEGKTYEEIKDYFDALNNDQSHMSSNDDICTPLECVKMMIDSVPEELWSRKKIAILDPCCGNGNFGAYCSFKTNPNNIYYNDFNETRICNCKKILNPKHINFGDAFDLCDEFDRNYDLIMANPPYSGGGNKNRSISNDFIEAGIDLLNCKGYLCFVTPNNWMTYNNNNTTLKKLLALGSFIVINNDVKKYFPKVGSSFTVIVWQKGVMNNKTTVINTFLKKDIQKEVCIPRNINFIPLYISQNILNVISKAMSPNETGFAYRCDLHNFTQKKFLSDEKTDVFKYETIHTARKTRYASKKQDIYDKYIIVIPLSTYFIPYIRHHVNTTQSVGYYAFDTKDEAKCYLKKLSVDYIKVIVHITRYGNFNNIMVLKHIIVDAKIDFTDNEKAEISSLARLIKY